MSKKDIAIVIALAVLVASLVTAAVYFQDKAYQQQTIEHCQQFKTIPQEHLDRVPDGCIAEYFKEK